MERHEWNSEIETCEFLASLIKMTKAEKVLEVGTFEGESTAEMAEALPEHGQLFTIDIEEFISQKNAKRIKKAKCKFNRILQDGTSWMRGFERNYFDFAFIDSMHHWSHILPEFKEVEKVVKFGGIIAYHDSIHIRDVKQLMDYAESHGYRRVDLMTTFGRGLTLLQRF